MRPGSASEPATTDLDDIRASHQEALRVCAGLANGRPDPMGPDYHQLAIHLHQWLQGDGRPNNCTRDDLYDKRRSNGLTSNGVYYRTRIGIAFKEYQHALDGGARGREGPRPSNESRRTIEARPAYGGNLVPRQLPPSASSARPDSPGKGKEPVRSHHSSRQGTPATHRSSPRHREPSHKSFDNDDDIHGDFLREERERRRYKSRSSHGTPEYYTKAEGKRPRR